MSEKPDVQMVARGSAAVLPPGTLPTVALQGDDQTMTIEIVTADEIPEAKVVYPDGYEKWHQAKDIIELLGKIGGTLRGRYGIYGYSIVSTPGVLEVGDIKINGLSYDKPIVEETV